MLRKITVTSSTPPPRGIRSEPLKNRLPTECVICVILKDVGRADIFFNGDFGHITTKPVVAAFFEPLIIHINDFWQFTER